MTAADTPKAAQGECARIRIVRYGSEVTMTDFCFSIINISIDVSQIMENPINNDRFINLTLKRGKESGKLYAINNEFYQKN